MTASILQQLLALYFTVICSQQLSSSDKSLVGEKNSFIYLKDFTDLDFFFFFIFFFFSCFCFCFFVFFHFLSQMPVYFLCYAKRMLYSQQLTISLTWRHLNPMILINFETLNSISNIFQETHHLLVLTDPAIIYIYLRTTGKHFRDQANLCHPTSKLLKCYLVQTLNTFQNYSLSISELIFSASLYITQEYDLKIKEE